MLLIPAIDVRAGRCVRLRQGDFAAETLYAVEPAQLARRYRALGATWLHVVDLDGARDGVPVNGPIIANLARHQNLRLQVGGGIRTAAVIEALLAAGVARVVIGSAAVERPAEVASWIKCFGAERICVALDVRIDPSGEPYVHTHGWTRNGALSLWNAIDAFPKGTLKHVLCTDIERDGMLAGPNLLLYEAALARFPNLSWQASGGIRRASDLSALANLGLTATLSGKALLEHLIPSQELQPFLPDASSPVSTYATGRL
jgi:phosphoribosylformimino-5-aminoimidazole carboxamide ribotide isomerase